MNNIMSKLFKTSEGKYVFAQFPNIPLFGWGIFLGLSFLPVEDSIKQSLAILSQMFLFVWAYLEATQGVNLFRKLLGIFFIAYIIINIFN
jgi:hypothetical protein